MRGRERADGGGGRGDRVNGVNRSQLKFFTGTALDFRWDRNCLSCSRIADHFRVILSARQRFIVHKTLHLTRDRRRKITHTNSSYCDFELALL